MKRFHINQFSFPFLLLCIAIVSSCSSSSGRIRLCDYKHITVPAETLTISEDDLNSSIIIDMYAFNVLIPKATNSDVVELDDVVTVSILIGDDEGEYNAVVGAKKFGEEFDDCVLGKKTGDSFSFAIEGITAQATILSISVYADAISDEIAQQYYGCSSAEDALNRIKEDIARARIFEYVYPEIINCSMVSGFYEERDEYVRRATRTMLRDAENEGCWIDDVDSINLYLTTEIGVSFKDYQYGLEAFYDEYLILSELMRQEGATVSEEEITSYYEFVEGHDEDDLFGPMGKEYAYYELYYERCPEVIFKYYRHLFKQ